MDVIYLLLEFMDQGTLFDFLEKREKEKLDERTCLKILSHICLGIQSMHRMNPPVQHRDLKVENVLFDGKNFKLCDFGSVTSEAIDFGKLSKYEYDTAKQTFEKRTTITYRPPEMCDPYLQLRVDTKADIWMIGCILFCMAFYKHPFQECTTLIIVNAGYFIPEKHNFSPKFENLIRNLLTPSPALRYNIDQLIGILDSWDNGEPILLNKQAEEVKREQMKRHNPWNDAAWNTKLLKKQQYEQAEAQFESGRSSADPFADQASRLQNHQLKAEFFDFDVSGLKKFQNSKKYIQPSQLQAQPQFKEFQFPQANDSTPFEADFLSWDTPNPGNQKPSNPDPFSGFDFSLASSASQGNQGATTFFQDDIFGGSTSKVGQPGQPTSQVQVSGGTSAQFWDPFGDPQQLQPVLPQSGGSGVKSSVQDSSRLGGSHSNTNDMLLQLSLEPEAHDSASKPQEQQTTSPGLPSAAGNKSPESPSPVEAAVGATKGQDLSKSPNAALLDLEI